MLTKIELQNFKCFKELTTFPLGKLTLLTGINGRGKSSLLQSLVLMRQSIEHNEQTTKLILNGNCLNLGRFDEIRNTGISRQEPILFKYHYDSQLDYSKYTKIKVNGVANYFFIEKINDDMVAQISQITFKQDVDVILMDKKKDNYKLDSIHKKNDNDDSFTSEATEEFLNVNKLDLQCPILSHLFKLIPDCSLFTEGSDREDISHQILTKVLNFAQIHYISADRLAPQDFYLKSNLPKFPNVASKGELTVNILHRKKDDLVNDKLCLGEDAKTLSIQTQEWLNKIFDGAKVQVSGSETNILELMFNTSLSKERFRPANIGFGYHCILPIIVSGLIAQEGEILIVENPEAHLHPKAQSELAKFLAKVSSCGVQVFVESHSDHILNGLRIAVLDHILSHQDLSILYFSQKIGKSVVQIPVDPEGKIEEWPEGFFDQMDKDFELLFGI